MTPPAATILATTAAPLLLSLLGTAVLLGYALRPARRGGRTAWRTLRRLASRPAALLCVCLMALFAQLGGSLDKHGGNRVLQVSGGSVMDAREQAPVRSVPDDTLLITAISPLTNDVFRLTLQWDAYAYYPDDTLDVWATTNLLAGPWEVV